MSYSNKYDAIFQWIWCHIPMNMMPYLFVARTHGACVACRSRCRSLCVHTLKRPLHDATWGRIMWGLTHELRTLWPQSVYMASVPACITDKSLTSCWPEITMYWRQRPLLCINIYIYIYTHFVDIILLNLNKRENRKQNENKLALVYKFCHCTLKLFLQHLREAIFCT